MTGVCGVRVEGMVGSWITRPRIGNIVYVSRGGIKITVQLFSACSDTSRPDVHGVETAYTTGGRAKILYSVRTTRMPFSKQRVELREMEASRLSRDSIQSMQLYPRSTAATNPGHVAFCENACMLPPKRVSPESFFDTVEQCEKLLRCYCSPRLLARVITPLLTMGQGSA
jgi:hypothetical protein